MTYSADGSGLQGADAVIVVVGELPYAEMKGDRSDLSLSPEDMAMIQKAKAAGAPVITMLLSGRPLILGPALDKSDALLAAWLPGTEGQGVADVLFGDYLPTGKLPALAGQHAASGGCRREVALPLRIWTVLLTRDLPVNERPPGAGNAQKKFSRRGLTSWPRPIRYCTTNMRGFPDTGILTARHQCESSHAPQPRPSKATPMNLGFWNFYTFYNSNRMFQGVCGPRNRGRWKLRAP